MLVVKVGGAEGIDYDNLLSNLSKQKNFVLVHGGKSQTSIISEKLGKPPVWVTSVSGHTSRYTDRETMEIFTMVYAGKMNKMIVEKLQGLGVNAVGLCGLDGGLIRGKRKTALKIIDETGKMRLIRDDYSGRPDTINIELLELLIGNGYVPVVGPPILGDESQALNADSDRIAAVVASSLKADTLVLFTNVAGLFRDINDKSSLIREIPRDDIDKFMHLAKSTMKKKILAAKEALEGGVNKVIIASANVTDPLTNALNNNGTVIS